MEINLHLILETEKPKNVQVVLNRLQKKFPFEISNSEPYSKGGTSVNISYFTDAPTWPQLLFETLQLAQSFGYGWGISGVIKEDISLTSSDISVSGIEWACISVENVITN